MPKIPEQQVKCLKCFMSDPGAVMVKSYKAEIKGLRRKVRRLEKCLEMRGFEIKGLNDVLNAYELKAIGK